LVEKDDVDVVVVRFERFTTGVRDTNVIASLEPQCETVGEGYLVVDEEDGRRVG
jgi:hypothetical protein